MELNLREHQLAVVDALRNGFKSGHRTQLLYAPTGFGKTEVAIYLMKAALEKGTRAAILLDRIVLVEQTSMRLSKYGLDHGVFQSGHWKFDPSKRLQVCSAQTLERMEDFPELDLLIVDECHVMRKQTIEYIKNTSAKVIGLTATPFTKGLGSVYENVITGAATEFLVEHEWLAPLRVFIAKEIDMTGAKKVAGEWSQDEVTERGMQITGDIVQEWIKKTHEIFGGPRKTIVFCAGVAHGSDLVAQFAALGYNFASISYKDSDDLKAEVIKDFSRPDTQIHGLIATDILTRGFDVPDVMIGISARPFSKSLSSHVQQMGRVMRSYPGKKFGVWLDHSGNYLRFREDWDAVYSEGVESLDDCGEKAKKEPTEKEKKDAKCQACGHVWPRGSDICPNCGCVREKKPLIETVPGTLEELGGVAAKADRQKFYSELLFIASMKNYNPHWAAHKYRERFGVWPRGLDEGVSVPSPTTINWVKSRQIAWAKAQRKS
jgi:superfamily II DNA or RNA helicase